MLDLSKDERTLILNLLGQIVVNPTSPEAPKMVTLVQSIVAKLAEEAPSGVSN